MRARLQDLSPSSVAAWLKRKRGARRGATKPKRQHRPRRGRGFKALDPDTTAVAAPAVVQPDTTAVAVFTPGTPPVASGAGPLAETVAALASLPCGLSSAVADDSLVCSICTEVRVCVAAVTRFWRPPLTRVDSRLVRFCTHLSTDRRAHTPSAPPACPPG